MVNKCLDGVGINIWHICESSGEIMITVMIVTNCQVFIKIFTLQEAVSAAHV